MRERMGVQRRKAAGQERGRTQPAGPATPQAVDSELSPGNAVFQRQAAPAATDLSAETLGRALAGPSPSQPLDPATRDSLEPHFGHSFADVRVHADGEADRLARAVEAAAFTSGRDIFFREGAYNPGSQAGMHLLAHEAAHTVQQAAGPVAGTPGPSGVLISDPSDRFERAAERAADSLVAQAPTTPPPVLAEPTQGTTPRGHPVGYPPSPPGVQRQWAGAPAGGPNAGETSVGQIRRIPIEGLSLGNQDPSMRDKSGKQVETVEEATGRAIVLIPSSLDTARPVEVLLHLHGHNIGYRQRKGGGTVRDQAVDRLEQQLQASGRPMVAVLPQGTTTSGFGKGFDGDAYIKEVFNTLAYVGVWLKVPAIERVVMTGHSGGGGPISAMLGEPGQPRLPSKLGELALFDAINGDGQLAIVQQWVLKQLAHDLSQLTKLGIAPAEQGSYLDTSMRFRAYHTTGDFYASRHVQLKGAIEGWFKTHAAKLGGVGSTIYQRLRDNYQVIATGHGDHDAIMGRNDRLKDALGALPPVPAPVAPAPVAPVPTPAGAGATGAPTIQRAGFGDLHLAESGSHHQGVVDALSKPDGADYPAAYRVLNGLSMSDLLTTLVELNRLGHLNALIAHHAEAGRGPCPAAADGTPCCSGQGEDLAGSLRAAVLRHPAAGGGRPGRNDRTVFRPEHDARVRRPGRPGDRAVQDDQLHALQPGGQGCQRRCQRGPGRDQGGAGRLRGSHPDKGRPGSQGVVQQLHRQHLPRPRDRRPDPHRPGRSPAGGGAAARREVRRRPEGPHGGGEDPGAE